MPLAPDLESWLRLALTPGLGADSFRRLLATFGDPAIVLKAGHGSLSRVVPARVAQSISAGLASTEKLDQTAAWLDDPNHHVVTLADVEYPKALLNIPDPPPLLYVAGQRALLNHPALTIVGSRNATAQGCATAESFARALSDAGLTIASGLALGIDAAAHRGGLAGRSRSIAVVGTGLDTVFPARNVQLAQALEADGAVLSEYPLGTAPVRANFPRRNRLLSGLARGCLVVEAALSSGSLITARLANEQGKEVFAVPGSIHSPLSKGCHALIKQGAKLTESAQDLLEELGMTGSSARADAPRAQSGDDEPELLRIAGYDLFDIDQLAARSGAPTEEIIAAITRFELEGRIAALPGGKYQRTR